MQCCFWAEYHHSRYMYVGNICSCRQCLWNLLKPFSHKIYIWPKTICLLRILILFLNSFMLLLEFKKQNMIRIILVSKRVKLDLWQIFFSHSTMYLDLFCMSTRKRLLAHQIVTALRVSDDYLRHSTYLVIGHENFRWTNSCSVS